jgi:anti-sigma regulatory factor (Ser/Thr protein kinase)
VSAEPLAAYAGDDRRHCVAIYQGDDELVGVVSDWAASALGRGESALLVCTGPHRQALRAVLGENFDVESLVAEQRLLVLDAETTLTQFMINARPDPARFEATIGALVTDALRRGTELRAFGEMVALLWQAGEPEAALALERLWDDLQDRHNFSLLCAYPNRVVTQSGPEDYVTVCGAHTAVVAGPPVAPRAEVTQNYPAHVESPRLARRFVREALEQWGLSDLSDDASLIVTELATNAVRHARSDFAVSLSRPAHRLRITVGDNAETGPKPRDAGRSGSGRGLHLVAAVAGDWGHDSLDRGKLVWAELDCADGRAS